MSKASILIVEDEHIVALDIQNSLEHSGYQVAGHADRGEDAIKKADELHPDLILMDIGLKGKMDGIEAATQIRARFDLPVIFLTAFSNQSTLERAREAEPYGYILKPFDEHELVIAIEMALYKHGMEHKLRESENKFHSVIKHSSDGIVLTDEQGNLIEWNLAAEQISGLQRADVLGLPLWELIFRMLPKENRTSQIHDALKNEWSTVVKSGYASGLDQLAETEIETQQGERRVIQTNGFAIETIQGRLGGAIMRNITTQKLLEQAERTQRQLAEALLDTALALSSTLMLDDVLGRILDNVGKLVTYDAAMVLLLDGHTIQKIRYHNRPKNESNQLMMGNMQANLINVPILHTVIDTRQPCLIRDIQQDTRWRIVAIPDMERVRSFICAPLEIRGHVVGIINIISATPGFFTPLHSERLMTFASQAAVAIENAQLFEQTKYLSTTDSLTGLNNRRYFFEIAKIEFERVQRYERTLSVTMVDIDHFKNINDAHGHAVGDQVLHEIAARIKNSIRTVDIVARYGGEEFIVLMPETNLEAACQVAERVRQSVADRPIEVGDVTVLTTLSLGVAETDKNINQLDQLIKYADQALYNAKDNGRNRIKSYSPER